MSGPSADGDAVLWVENLEVAYSGNRALDIQHLTLGRGEVLGVAGANGAGKSTLVNALAGWSRGAPRVRGEVRLGGEDISALPAHLRVRRGLQLVPEGGAVFFNMTVAENLRALATPHENTSRRFDVERVFALFPNLAARRHNRAGTLSGGERQMLAMGRALRMSPLVLMLDEPSIGLAPRLIAGLLRSIRDLANEGLSVLLVEQNVHAALDVVDRLALLERGRIVAQGSAVEMREDPRLIEAYLGSGAEEAP